MRAEDHALELSPQRSPHHSAARHGLPGRCGYRPGLRSDREHLVRGLGINTAFAQDTDRADTYRLLALFGDIFERVRGEYVDQVSDRELIENAINGMLTGLDPHSAYMNADEFREMQEETSGEFGGIGIEVVPDNGFLMVISLMDDTPASRAGIKAGDIITKLNGKSVRGLSQENLIGKMRGRPNSKITLTIKRDRREEADRTVHAP